MKKKTSIEEQLKECQKLKDEYLAGWKRAQADFINYKKGEAERNKQIRQFANEDLILEILLILDNLYIAEAEIPDKLKKDQWVKGLLQIKNQISDFLKSQGLEEINSVGERFNPQFHEAVELVEKDNSQSGIVVEEIKKGYILKSKVIRPSQVKITK